MTVNVTTADIAILLKEAYGLPIDVHVTITDREEAVPFQKAMADGNRLMGIKVLREITGGSLLICKNMLEVFEGKKVVVA